jgi:hypothetical protein
LVLLANFLNDASDGWSPHRCHHRSIMAIVVLLTSRRRATHSGDAA